MRRGRRGDPPSPRLRGTGKSGGEEAKRPSDSSLLRFLGPRLIMAAWLVFVLAVYFRLQAERVLKLAGAIP
jgi:hypothetical protein